MDYLNFEPEVGPGQGHEYPAEVIRFPAGLRTATKKEIGIVEEATR